MSQVISTKPKLLYHITAKNFENARSILKNGLKCNEEGQIFLFENKSIIVNGSSVENCVSDCIAAGQLGVKSYSMFEIDSKGLYSDLIPDEVGEFTAKLQWYILQEKIEPKYISILGHYKTNFTPFFSLP